MRQDSSVMGFLALCAVLIAAISVPSTHNAKQAAADSTGMNLVGSALGPALNPQNSQYPVPRQIQVRSAVELDRLFAELDYQWPIEEQTNVPPLEVTALPLDLGALETPIKKAVFFRTLLPLVLFERNRIRQQRATLLDWMHMKRPPSPEILEIAKHYRVKGDLDNLTSRQELLRRVDTVPTGLALAQAANESGWGTSRFAVNANNLFGVWTFKRHAGLAPRSADSDTRHAVRAYPSLRRAVRSYFFNINVGHAYEQLREMREHMRRAGKPLDALKLAAGLVNYSSRGEAYVEEIRRMIRLNKLDRLGVLTIARAEPTPDR